MARRELWLALAAARPHLASARCQSPPAAAASTPCASSSDDSSHTAHLVHFIGGRLYMALIKWSLLLAAICSVNGWVPLLCFHSWWCKCRVYALTLVLLWNDLAVGMISTQLHRLLWTLTFSKTIKILNPNTKPLAVIMPPFCKMSWHLELHWNNGVPLLLPIKLS